MSNSVTPWTVARLCPWDSPGKNTGVGGHFPPPGDLPNPGVEISSPGAVLAGVFFITVPSGKPHIHMCVCLFFFRFFSIIGYYKILNIVFCAIQKVLV